MLEPKEIERLEARAGCARNGYALDKNIDMRTYAEDMIALLNDRREWVIECGKYKLLAEERERRQTAQPPRSGPGMPDKVENGLKELPEQLEPTPVQEQPRKKVRT